MIDKVDEATTQEVKTPLRIYLALPELHHPGGFCYEREMLTGVAYWKYGFSIVCHSLKAACCLLV